MPNSRTLKVVYWIVDVPEKSDDFIKTKNITSTYFNIEYNTVISLWRLYFNSKCEYSSNNNSNFTLFKNMRLINISTDGNKNAFYVFLECCSDPKEIEFDCELQVSIVNSSFTDSKYILCHEWNNQNEACCDDDEYCGIGLIPSDVLVEERNTICPDGKLHLKFTISTKDIIDDEIVSLAGFRTSFASEQRDFNDPVPESNFSETDDIFNMITTSPESDFLIKIDDGTVLKAHKSLLRKKSPVFDEIFSMDMAIDSIDIIDFKGRVIQEMLRFIYFGNVQNIEQINIELLKAAKAYKIDELSVVCMKSIVAGVNYDNVINIVKFADENDSKELFNLSCEKIQW